MNFLSKDTLKNLVKYDPKESFNLIDNIERSLNEPFLINCSHIHVKTWINKYLMFNNYQIVIDVVNDWIEIIIDKNTYIVCSQLDLNKILFSSIHDTNENNVYKYTFTKLAVKLSDQNEKFKQLILTDREKCTIMMSHIYIVLFPKNNMFTNHTINVDINSIIGEHVIESDRLRLETLSCNLGKNHQFVSIKKSLLDKKIDFYNQHNDLLHQIKTYQKKIFDICEKFIKEKNPNKTHTFDNVYSSLKSLAGTLKSAEIFCRIVANNSILLSKSSSEGLINPMDFLNKYRPVINNLVDQIVGFNSMGCAELKSNSSIVSSFAQSIDSWDQIFQYTSKKSKQTMDDTDTDTIIDPMDEQIKQIRSILSNTRSIIESIDKLMMVGRYESGLIGVDKDTEEYYLSSQSITDDLKDFFTNNIKFTDQTAYDLIDQYPFLSKYISEIIVSNAAIRYNSMGLITGTVHGHELSNIDKISISCPKILQNIFLNLSVESGIDNDEPRLSKEITDLITEYTRKFIIDDIYLCFQILLLYDTIKYIESIIDSDKIEYHIKGGFCRDIILRYLSSCSNPPLEKTFKKSIKDIDIAMNIDPEIFTFYLCKISVERYNYIPIKRWNNAEKTEKGKNISVWSVKLIEDYEPMEFVHFRSDQYDPETSAVIAEDRYLSIDDDMRRDVPWPSFCLNTMSLVDYFDIIGMLNRGQHIIRTPPPYDQMYQNQYESNNLIPVNISDSEINYQTHIETSDRILRLFKFITNPFDRWFAYNYDSRTKQFLSVNKNGFTADPRLIRLYTDPRTGIEIESLKLIHQYIRRWFENGLMSSVFKSIINIPTLYPHRFVQLLDQFKLIDVLFFNNYNIEMFLTYTATYEKMIEYSGINLSTPYQILGLGVKDTDEMLRQMKLLSFSNTTQTMALILAKHGKLLFDRSTDQSTDQSNDKHWYESIKQNTDVQNFVLEIISESSGSYYFFHCVELIRLLGFNLNDIDPKRYKTHTITKKIKEKYNLCVANIIGDYIGMIALSTQIDKQVVKQWFGKKIIEHIFAMISRTISVAASGLSVMCPIDKINTSVIQQKTVKTISKNVAQSMKTIIGDFNKIDCDLLEAKMTDILDRLFVPIQVDKHYFHKSIIGQIINHIDEIVDRLKSIMETQVDLIYLKQIFINPGSLSSLVDSVYSCLKINKFDLIDFDLNISLPTTIMNAKIAEKYFADTTKYH
jgi:hypothetical protein